MRVPKLLSLVSLSEIMAGAHEMRRRNERVGHQLAYNAHTRKWDQTAQAFLAQWSPLSLSDALRQSWAHARRRAEQIQIERSTSAEAEALRKITYDLTILNGRDRWQSEHYAENTRLQHAHGAAWEAARVSVP